MTRFLGGLVLAVLHLAAGVSAAATVAISSRRDLAPGETEWRTRMEAGQTLEVKGVIGQIDVVRASGPEAVVAVERGEASRVELLAHEQGYTLCVVQPSKNPKKPNECLPGTKGRLTQDMAKTDPPVRFKVQLPDGVGFLGRLAFGDMSARGVTGNLNLENQVGTITVVDSGTGFVDARSFGGAIDATLSPHQGPDKRTVNLGVHAGDVRLVLPPIPVKYTVWASFIESKIPFEKGTVPGTFSGVFGSDEAPLTLYVTVAVGRVQVRRP
jgi:hypothetical protein